MFWKLRKCFENVLKIEFFWKLLENEKINNFHFWKMIGKLKKMFWKCFENELKMFQFLKFYESTVNMNKEDSEEDEKEIE